MEGYWFPEWFTTAVWLVTSIAWLVVHWWVHLRLGILVTRAMVFVSALLALLAVQALVIQSGYWEVDLAWWNGFQLAVTGLSIAEIILFVILLRSLLDRSDGSGNTLEDGDPRPGLSEEWR